MQITMLKAKLHRARVTHVEIDYEGSCAMDTELMQTIGILEYEQLQIYDIDNGNRFTTYAVCAEAGSGTISINGAAAHKASVGDRIIICAYASMPAAQAVDHKPVLGYVDHDNRIVSTRHSIPMQAANGSQGENGLAASFS